MQFSSLGDEELMSKYQGGSDEAFSVLYGRHSGKVLGFVKKRIHDPQKANEVFQEVFLKMHKSKHLYNRTLPFLPWLFSISKSVIIDSVRSANRKVKESTETDLELLTGNILVESSVDLQPHLEALGSSQKLAMQLRFVDEKTFEEIAEALNTSPMNARKLISRGLKRLKELVSEGDRHERQK